MPGMGLFQPWHLLLILLIVLIVFGAGKLGQVGGALGQSVKEFKASVGDEDEKKQGAVTSGESPKIEARATASPAVERPADSLRREEI